MVKEKISNFSVLKSVREAWQNIYRNKFAMLISATILQFFMVTLGMGALLLIFHLILQVSGQANLTKDNIFLILLNPFGLALSIFYILVAGLLILAEFSILISIVDSQNRTAFSWKNVAKNSLSRMKSLLGPQLLFFIFYFILMIPFENLGLSSAISKNLYIPKFISGEIMKTTAGMWGYFALLAVILYVNFRLILVLPLTILKKQNLSKSIRESWVKTRKSGFQIFATIGIFEVILGFFALLAVIFGVVIFSFIDKTGTNLFAQTIFYTLIDSILFAFSILTKIAIVNVLLIFIRQKDSQKPMEISKNKEVKYSKKFTALLVFLFAVSIIFNAFQIKYVGLNEKILRIAHRGDVKSGIENSLEALKAAAEKRANLVEMDIQMTKDQKFVVMHDYNLKRLTGEDKSVRDLTLAEITAITLKDGARESKIPSFDEFVENAKKLNIDLLVELKPNGGEPENFAEIFVAKMKELGISKKYRAMSLDLKLMKKIEALAPEIKTGFVIPLQFGFFEDAKTDFYVIEDFSYTPLRAEEAHLQNREIFVWTVNDETSIMKYLQTPVDGIITDELAQVDEIKQELKEKNTYFDKIMRMIGAKY